jgi:hypothetical protein
MNKVTLGLLVGIVLGLLAGAYTIGKFDGFALLSAAIATGAAGALSGLAAERSTNRAIPIILGVGLGALGWYWLGRNNVPGAAALTGAIIGAIAGAIVALKGRRAAAG